MLPHSLTEDLRAGLDWQRGLYRDLHRHPELSLAEHWTSARIVCELEAMGLEAIRIAETGVVAILTNGTGRTFLARADIDGLPVLEDTGLDYASEQAGIMHACGHDMHITALLGAVRLLNTHRDLWRGTYIALFQPAEETAQGARALVDAGLTQLIPRPDAAYSQHIGPGPANTVAFRAGPTMSAADSIRIRIIGSGSHASTPQLAVDPVVLTAMIVVRLQTVVARVVAPSEFSVVTVGALHAGTKSNVIPDDAEILVNLRHYDNDVRARVIAAVERIVTKECEAAGSPKPPTFDYYDQFPLTSNDADLAEQLSGPFRDEFGEHFITAPQGQGSEDFSIIPDAFGAPYVYAFVGSVDPEEFAAGIEAGIVFPGNHSPKYAPAVEQTCETATRSQVTAALAFLQ